MVSFSRQSRSSLAKWLWTVDKITLFVSLALLVIGLILDITASPAVARRINFDDYWFVRKHVVYVLASVVTIFALSMLKLKTIRRLSILGFIIILILMIVTPFWGIENKGARRWLSICGFSLQASEFMKPIFIIVTAWLLDCGKKYDYFQGMWISIALCRCCWLRCWLSAGWHRWCCFILYSRTSILVLTNSYMEAMKPVTK